MLVVSLSQKLLNYIVKGGNNIMYTFTIQVLLQMYTLYFATLYFRKLLSMSIVSEDHV